MAYPHVRGVLQSEFSNKHQSKTPNFRKKSQAQQAFQNFRAPRLAVAATSPRSASERFGPTMASSTVRGMTRYDYDPGRGAYTSNTHVIPVIPKYNETYMVDFQQLYYMLV